jgi:lipocalin
LGVWYEEKRYDDEFQAEADCVSAEYRLNTDGSVAVRNSLFWLQNQTFHQMNGRALIAFPNADNLEGRLNVTFFPQRKNFRQKTITQFE